MEIGYVYIFIAIYSTSNFTFVAWAKKY